MRDYVVAIDLGTSCTAYSWKGASDPEVTVSVPDKAVRVEDVRGKTPTVLLIRGKLDPHRNKMFNPAGVEAFGREAETRFRSKDFPDNAQLFQRFKMELHKTYKDGTRDDLLNAPTASFTDVAELKLWDVFVLALKHIKDAALESLAAANVKPDRVSWVLTVPACCTDEAKNFMRDAAIKADLIKDEEEGEHLRICKEPVAACLALESELAWKDGNKYLVVDCGGGTVDICAFELAAVGPPPLLSQVGDNISEPWGSTFVDEQFRAFLMMFRESVAPDVSCLQLEAFEKNGWYRVLQDWEELKVGLKSVNESCRIDLSEMMKALRVSQPETAMDNARRGTNRGGKDLVGGAGTSLVLKPAQLRRFFRPQCDKIAKAVTDKLKTKELEGVTSVVMVGGFSGSVHVQEAVRKSVLEQYPDDSVKVKVAGSPDLAIVQGAARFAGSLGGSRPRYPRSGPQFEGITCDKSYGILTSGHGSWDAAFFEAFLLKGEGYPDGHKKEFDFTLGSSCKLAFGSCASRLVRPGRNMLSDIGGIAAVGITDSKIIPVPEPAAPASTGWGMCCRCTTSAVEQDQKSVTDVETETPILVEFSLIGMDLHVEVKSKRGGKVLLKTLVRFGK